ncbi:hypothetical protein JCM10213_001428 [Rhodosporidiobolus nylandii]
MVSFAAFLITYVLGGLTFIPLCLFALCATLFYLSPVVDVPQKTGLPDLSPKALSEDEHEPVSVYRAGWLTVRRTYEPTPAAQNDGYVGMLASGYRSFLDNRSKDPRRTKPKDRFFAVLKQNVLFLYEGEDQAECWAAIEVSAHEVVIYPEDYVDGELFVKRTAIKLKPKKSDEEDPSSPTGQAEGEMAYDKETGKQLPFYLFAKVNSDKEDWYHSLVLASRLNSPSTASTLAADRALFSPEDMARLVESIDASPDSIPMRWFNALLGRMFLAVHRTSTLEGYLTSRLVRKLKRVKLPSLLSEVTVREVNVGSSVPLFSKPMLKDLTSDGDASMEVHVGFVGAVRVTIETVATVSLGSRFKPYSVRLVLAVVLRELDGTMLVKMKRPPSSRIWFGFTAPPRMSIDIEPVVSTRQIKWSLVTGPIESRIRELIAESLVLPHMDDLSFFDTRTFPTRGGIYGPCLRSEPPPLSAEAPPSSAPTAEEDLDKEAEKEEARKEEERTGEIVPTASVETEEVKEEKAGAVRQRRGRRGSSSASSTLTTTAAPTATAASTPAPPAKSSSTSSSVSSGLANLSASIAQWRENRAGSSPGPRGAAGAAEGEGVDDSSVNGGGKGKGTKEGRGRKGSWFSPSPSKASSLSTASSPAAVGSRSATDVEGKGAAEEEVSAKKLREVLARRAESRERERERRAAQEAEAAAAEAGGAGQREAEGEGEGEKPLPVPGVQVLPLNEPPEQPQEVKDTEPEKGDLPLPPLPPRTADSGVTPILASAPFPAAAALLAEEAVTDSPLSSSASSVASSLATPPAAASAALPTSRSTSTLSISASSLAPSTSEPGSTAPSSLAPPPPPPRRHSPSPSMPSLSSAAAAPSAHPHPPAPPAHPHPPPHTAFHGSQTSASTSPAGLLASWRSKATNPAAKEEAKEVLAQGVREAREKLGRWSAGWGKKSAEPHPASAPPSASAPSVPATSTHASAPAPAPAPKTPPRPAPAHSAHSTRSTRSARSDSLSLSSSPGNHIPSAHGSPSTSVSPSFALGVGVAPPAPSLSPSRPRPAHASSSSTSAASLGSAPLTGGGGGGVTGGYRRASMMTLPGLAAPQAGGRERREKVRGDHLSVTDVQSPPAPTVEAAPVSTEVEKRGDGNEEETPRPSLAVSAPAAAAAAAGATETVSTSSTEDAPRPQAVEEDTPAQGRKVDDLAAPAPAPAPSEAETPSSFTAATVEVEPGVGVDKAGAPPPPLPKEKREGGQGPAEAEEQVQDSLSSPPVGPDKDAEPPSPATREGTAKKEGEAE